MSYRMLQAVVFAMLLSPSYGQTPTGEVRGRVVDSTEAIVTGAAVEVQHLETNVTLRTVTNSEGNFLIRNLNPGVYKLDVAKEGFKRVTRQPIEVRVGDVLDIPVALTVGAVTESVTVSAESPMLETANATVGQVLDNRRITDLPTPGNSAIYMLQFVPGSGTSTPPTNLWPPDAVGSASSTIIGGGRAGFNEFAIDGTPMMTRGGSFTLNPPQEMVQEMKVTTAAYDASLSRFLGGHVNLVLKSGTNALRGNALFQNMSRGMMAKDFFTVRAINNPATGPVTDEKIDRAWPPQRVVRFQANASGPVMIPKLYDGRNRTFWTFGSDAVSRRRAAQSAYTVPTELQRNGNFSALLPLGAVYQIYDPATIAPAANGRFSRLPFAGNIIPANRIDPIAKKLMDFYPMPNAPGNADGSANYTNPNMANSPYHGYLGRVDHVYNDRHRVFASFNNAYTDNVSDRYFMNDSTGTGRTRRQRGLTVEHTYTPGASTILNFRYGLNRFRDDTAHNSIGYDLGALGIAPGLLSQLDPTLSTIPQVTISGTTGLGGNSGSRPRTTYHNLLSQGTHIRGNHTLKVGIEFRSMAENVWNLGNVSPSYTFAQTWTRGPLDNSATAPVGQGLASFLLGLPTGGAISNNSAYSELSKYWGLFVQDDWKVTRKLTVNLGLRWDYDTPTTERFNRTTRGYAFGVPSPVEAAARANYALNPISEIAPSAFRVPGGLTFASENGVPRGLIDPDRNNIAPRIGLAYQIASKTVFRLGYGLFFAPMGSDQLNVSQPGFSQSTPLVASQDNGISFIANLQNPFPGGLLSPVGSAAGLNTYLGQGITILNPGIRNGLTHRWSANLQQVLPGRLLIEVGYMGNKSLGLLVSRDSSPIPNQYLSTSPVRDAATISYLSQQVRNPFQGIQAFTGTGLASVNVARSQLLRAYPQYTGVSTTTNEGYAWYHSMQLRVEKRMSSGFTIQGSYTYSKNMEAVAFLNAGDAMPHRVVSNLDQTHVMATSGVYELPFGRGKRFLGAGRVTDLIAGGWSIQGTWQVQSGRPLDWGNILFIGDIKDIELSSSDRNADRWFNTSAGFNRNAAQDLASNLRTFPLRLNGVRAPGINMVNGSVFKNFKITERVGLQFRAEAVDVFNVTPYSTPNTSPTSGAFGTITTIGSGNTQRRVTLGGKLNW